MSWIHFILDFVGFLLWLNWRAHFLKPAAVSPGLSLLSTIRRTEPARGRHWGFLMGLLLLLWIRPLFYWQVGSGLNWTPRLDLELIVLPFRSDLLSRMTLYSFLSFGCFMGVVYLWLAFLAAVNRKLAHSDPVQRVLNNYLGSPSLWPRSFLVIAPLLTGALLWANLGSFFARLELLPGVSDKQPFLLECFFMGLAVYLSWIRLALALLVLHLLNSFIYFGSHPFWHWIQLTGANLAKPVQWLPLRFAKIDLAPIVMILFAAFIGWAGERLLKLGLERFAG